MYFGCVINSELFYRVICVGLSEDKGKQFLYTPGEFLTVPGGCG